MASTTYDQSGVTYDAATVTYDRSAPYTFTPPSGSAATPVGRPTQRTRLWTDSDPPLVQRCMRYFSPHYFAYWVFIWDDGSVNEYMPPATYDSKAKLLKTPEQRIVASFPATSPTTVSELIAAQLAAAGYVVANYP